MPPWPNCSQRPNSLLNLAPGCQRWKISSSSSFAQAGIPRADLPAPILRNDVLSMADLQPGMILNGTVRNVVDFGAFIDIGVKQDGLLHRSQIPRGRRLNVGDVLRNIDSQS